MCCVRVMYSILLPALAALLFLQAPALGLQCYRCKLPPLEEGRERNMSCLTEPRNITGFQRQCPTHLRACMIVRVEHKETGKVAAFIRDCSHLMSDYVDSDATYTTYNRFCEGNLCNEDDGKSDNPDGWKERIVAILVRDEISAGSYPSPVVHVLYLPLMLIVKFLK